MEFWGDEVEEIRYFKVADQRSLGDRAAHGLWAPPCRELLLTDEVRARAADAARRAPRAGRAARPDQPGRGGRGHGGAGAGAGRRAARWCCTSCPAGAHVVLCDPERVRTRAADLVRTSEEFLDASWAAAAGGGKAPVDLGAASLRELDDVRDGGRAARPAVVGLITVQLDAERRRCGRRHAVDAGFERRPTYRGDTEAALRRPARLGARRLAGRAGLRRARHRPQRAVERLRAADIPARLQSATGDARAGRRRRDHRAPGGRPGRRRARLAVLTEADLTGQRGSLTMDSRRMPSRRRNAIDPIQLQPATTWCTSSTASAGTSRWCAAPSTAASAST